MDNVLSFFLRAAAILFFVLALSVAAAVVNVTESCNVTIESVIEDDVMYGIRM